MYCREAGVRSLQKHIEKILRKVAFKVANKEITKVVIDENNLHEFVGRPKFMNDQLYENNKTPPGVVIGKKLTI